MNTRFLLTCLLVASIVVLLLAFPLATVYANCAPDGDAAPNNITCAGFDADGVNAGAGNDVITIAEGADIAGLIDGGDGFDILLFAFTGFSRTEGFGLKRIAALNPSNGSLSMQGRTFQWANIESFQLAQNVQFYLRLNGSDVAASAAIYCTETGGVEVWDVNRFTSQGTLGFSASPSLITWGIQQAYLTGRNQLLAQSAAGNALYALTSAQLQVNGYDLGQGYAYRFIFSPAACGLVINLSSLPVPQPTPVYPAYPTYPVYPPAPVYLPTAAPVLPTYPILYPGERLHIVQRGETLYRIGLRYGVSYLRIAARNGITNPNRIEVGQILIIPAY